MFKLKFKSIQIRPKLQHKRIIQQNSMRQILSKSGPFLLHLQNNKLSGKRLMYNFSAMPPNMEIQKAVEFQFKFRSILNLTELNEYLIENKQDIKKYGKTLLLQFLNEYPMQSFRRSRDEMDPTKREQKYKIRQKIYLFLIEFEDLNFYELNMRYAIFNKLVAYVGQEQTIIQEINKTDKQLIDLLKSGDLHVSDVMNWLYMLPLNYKIEHSCLAFDILQKKFQQPEVREYFRTQRGLPALIKRINELGWSNLRKYKNIIKFLCYQASCRDADSLEQVVSQLERLVSMKLNLVGQKVIPKLVDEIIDKFDAEFQTLTKNKLTLLRVFSIYRNLPLNYNIQFFNKIHNYLKSTRQLPSHLLIYLPYNKLSQSEVAYLQSKMFTAGREDIASKLIYTIYEPWYKDTLTPFIVKQAYSNLLQMWKKDGGKSSSEYQIYLSLIFRFIKIHNPIIDMSKLRQIFSKIVQKTQQQNYDVFNTFSVQAMIAFLEVCAYFDIPFNQKNLTSKIQYVLRGRKQRNSLLVYTGFLISAIKVHYNASHKKSRYFLTQFIKQIVNNNEVDFNQRIQLLFLIQKTINPQQNWSIFSDRLSQQLTTDIDCFVENYIKYDQKTLKLTNFIFNILYKKKVNFSTIAELLGSLNLKLLTSLKGKLISPLKKYINEMDLSKFDVSNSNMSTLVNSFRLLFYFKNEIPEFMEYFSIKLIQKIQTMLKQGQYLNGKLFASLSNYIMEVVANIDIKQKTNIIESIVSIIKTLRKRQGIFMKVYELDFLCNNQKYIKINKDVLQHHWNEVVQTLKKTQRVEHHKELMFIVVKLHCRQFVQLTPFDLRYFTQKCTQMIERSALNLSQIKECLGYDILECDSTFVIEKLKIYLSSLIKLAFRKDKRKQSYFLYQYYLKLFSKLQSKQMITEICQKLLYEKLYPVEISNIIPILNQNQIKNKKFIKRILQIMTLSDSYVSYEKMQVISWLEKISYDLPENDFNLVKLREKVQSQIIQKTSALKVQMKNSLNQQDRSIESGFEIDDPNFDKNYKIFIEYVWASLKHKNINTPQFKFICRYLFFSLQKIKGRIENPQERKQISKIKLYHVLKFIKEMGFFSIDSQKVEAAFREESILKQKVRKNKILQKMEKDLNFMKIESCQKLQKKLTSFGDAISYKAQQEVQCQGKNRFVEYYLQEKSGQNDSIIKNRFIIHTVKKYHMTLQSETLPQTDQQVLNQSVSKTKNQKLEENSFFRAQDVDVLEVGINQNEEDANIDEGLSNTDATKDSYIQESYLSLELKPEKELFSQKPSKQDKNQKKPLFSQLKSKKVSEKTSKSKDIPKLDTVLKVQKASQELCRNYNGYLKVEKSLIQLSTGLKCIIYDPETDIFFD